MPTKNVFEVLKERGYIAQATDESKLSELLNSDRPVKFYCGFDPTADSLHIGHFLMLMTMSIVQKAGHFPLILVGGATGLIGDPSGRQDLRKVLTEEQVQHNVESIKKQIARLIDLNPDKAMVVNNADWLRDLNYIEILRNVGASFSVNRMLSAECYKSRYEKGLTFLEFNYMIMQAYDFYYLNKKYDCLIQLGGNDQWSNMLAGVDLIRRKESKEVQAMTFQLLTNFEGQKMGKTAKGTIWLDENKCSVFDFYQYFRNVHDLDVIRIMKLLTFLPLEEIAKYEKLTGQELNEAKKRLAFEVTKLIHGEEKALKAAEQAKSLFEDGHSSVNMPVYELSEDIINSNSLLDILSQFKLIPSKAEGRRLIEQGGLSVSSEKITDLNHKLQVSDFNNEQNEVIVKKGKKNFYRLVLKH